MNYAAILLAGLSALSSAKKSGCYTQAYFENSKPSFFHKKSSPPGFPSRVISYHMPGDPDAHLNLFHVSTPCQVAASVAYHFAQVKMERETSKKKWNMAFSAKKRAAGESAAEEARYCCEARERQGKE